MKHTWRKVTAELLALAFAAGGLPANIGAGGIIGSTVIVASAEGMHDVTATLDFGADHEEFAQSFSDRDGCSVSGSCVTLTVSADKVYDVYAPLHFLAVAGTDGAPLIDNGECFMDVGEKPVNEYSDANDYHAEIQAVQNEDAGDSLTLYALWERPVTNTYEIVFIPPACDTEVTIRNYGSIATDYSDPAPSYILNGKQSNPNQGIWYSSYDAENNELGSRLSDGQMIGDKCYTEIGITAPFGYFFSDSFSAENFVAENCEIKGVSINYDNRFASAIAEVSAVHSDTVRREITKEPTATEPGIITYYCKCGAQTKTEEIPCGIYSISAASGIENGGIYFDKDSTFQKDIVTVTVEPDPNFRAARLYYAAGDQEIEITQNADGQYTFEMPASDVTVYAEFDFRNSVIIDFGEEHENAAALLAEAEGCTVTGQTVKFHFSDDATYEDARTRISELFSDASVWRMVDNGQKLTDIALNPISNYARESDIENERNATCNNQIGDSVTFYVLWADPVTELTITAPEYKCGQVLSTRTQDSTTRYEPCEVTLSEGLTLQDYHLLYTNWEMENGETVLHGGNRYCIYGFIKTDWNQYLPADAKIQVIGGELISFSPDFSNRFSISVLIQHDWDDEDHCKNCDAENHIQLTDGEYTQTAQSGGKYYKRFVFVVPKTDFAGMNKAIFTVPYNGTDYSHETQTYYTGLISNGITYIPASDASAIFVVTVSSDSEISDGLKCTLTFE